MGNILLKIKDPVSCLTHMAGAVFAAVGLVLMLLSAKAPIEIVAFTIFGSTMLLMYLASALYHMFGISARTVRLLRTFDHVMIYYFIAGTFTPFTLLLIEDTTRWVLFSVIWGIALLGTFFKIFWLSAPAWFSIALYLGMGWLGVLILPYAFQSLPYDAAFWIVAGGIFYTIGAVIYGIKKPNPLPPWVGFHEIWHVFVMAGSFSHFWVIYRYLPLG